MALEGVLQKILAEAGIDESVKVQDWNDDQLEKLENYF